MFLLALHIFKYFPVSLEVSIFVSVFFGMLVSVIMSKSRIARKILLLTAPESFCRTGRFIFLSLVTVEGIFRPVINICIAFVKAAHCTSGKIVEAGQTMLEKILYAIALRAPITVNNISKKLQSIFHPTVEQITMFFSSLFDSVGLDIGNPVKELRDGVTFTIKGHANASMEFNDDNIKEIEETLKGFVCDINDVFDGIKIITGVLSLLYVMLYIPYKKYKQMQMDLLPITHSTQKSSIIISRLKSIWGRYKRTFNLISNLTVILVFTFVVERVLVYVYFVSGQQYNSKPATLNQNASLVFKNNGSALGNVFSNALNDMVSANVTDQVMVNVTSCYSPSVNCTSFYAYIGNAAVIVLAYTTYLLEEFLKDEDKVFLFLSES